jgi:ABC-type Fe3+-siderophore transport system permease subunit
VHVLDRPHLPHAATIAAAGAALVIALTLLLASTLNDLTSPSTSGPSTVTPTPAESTSTGAGWSLSPFTNLLRSPVRAPWTAGL